MLSVEDQEQEQEVKRGENLHATSDIYKNFKILKSGFKTKSLAHDLFVIEEERCKVQIK